MKPKHFPPMTPTNRLTFAAEGGTAQTGAHTSEDTPRSDKEKLKAEEVVMKVLI